MDARLDSRNWVEVRDAVERTAEQLRAGDLSKDQVRSVGETFVRLATHTKWEVRDAVAQALEYLRHDLFTKALAPLLRDENASVRRDAERTEAKRAERVRSDYLKDDYAEILSKLYAELDLLDSPKARAAARKVAERHVSIHISQAHHELVKPLNALNMKLVAADQKLSKDRINITKVRRDIRKAQREAAYLIAMLKALRDFSSDKKLEFQSEGLREMVTDAIDLARTKKIRPQLAIAIDPDLRIEAARPRLVQAFSNLIRNSLEAFDEIERLPELRIEAQIDEPSDRVVLNFTDNGCGISEENLGTVFTFFTTTKRKKGGTGIGLALVKKIIESEHRGGIRIDSVEGKSTTVTVTLPREQERP